MSILDSAQAAARSPNRGSRASIIPVVLFAYDRPDHLRQTLDSIRANGVPHLYVYCDGSKSGARLDRVASVRAMVRAIDWCETSVIERTENLGLGRNILAGVSEVVAKHETFIVWEDDLVALPGTYAWMTAALRHYQDDPRVMSVTAWTHPSIVPAGIGRQPYLDARAECWVWGAWARSWRGMREETALQKMAAARRRGVSPDAYGADLPEMARVERRRNIWAVRWLYHHFEHGGLCVRPPWSMVEHIGFGASATNAATAIQWANPPLRAAPGVPTSWPEPVEHPACRMLWSGANAGVTPAARWRARIKQTVPESWRRRARAWFGWKWFEGNFAHWADALAASGGYDARSIVERVQAATLAVRDGSAAFERDGVTFPARVAEPDLVGALREIGERCGRRLRVLDFGGALGTTYWRHRHEFSDFEELRWDVVEQPGFAEVGRAQFANDELRFFSDLRAAVESAPHDVLLASTVLQYLSDPFDQIKGWADTGVPWLVVNNLPLHRDGADRIAMQRVPSRIYPASYPVWFFNRDAFFERLSESYAIEREFASEAVWLVGCQDYPSTGLVLRRKEKHESS